MASPCGHSFCGFCVEKFQSSNAGENITCQMCRQPVSAFCRNRLANSILALVEGECIWCKGQFPLHNAKEHVKNCGEVECKVAVKRAEKDAHKGVCLMGDVLCACGSLFKRVQEKQHKKTVCTFKELPCPLSCGQTIKRSV